MWRLVCIVGLATCLGGCARNSVPHVSGPDRVVATSFDSELYRRISDDSIPLGHEYSDYNRERGSRPRSGSAGNAARGVLLYIPNRVMDLLDTFRVDVGAGWGYGFALRLTKHAQMGYRHLDPGSMRFGLRGRRAPVFLEKGTEKGFVTDFDNVRERRVTAGELGAGLDLGIIGAYGGVCFDELADFVVGFSTWDFKEDDFE